MELSPEQFEQVYDAFLSAFDYSELKRFIFFRLKGRELAQIVSSTNLSDACYELLRKAQQDGWLADLIGAAVDGKSGNERFKSLALDLRLKEERKDSTNESTVRDGLGPDTSDPLLIIEDFKKDLEKIPADQTWNSEDYEHELDSLRSWLPKLRRHVRELIVKPGSSLEKSVLSELQFEDAIEDALDVVNAFELCLNCLLDSSRSQNVPDQTRYVQWFRRKSTEISECLSGLQHKSTDSESSRKEDSASQNINPALYAFIQRLRTLQVNDAIRLDERREMLAADSGIGSSLNAIIEYLKERAVPSEANVKITRELLTSIGGFIEHAAQAQKRLPSSSGPARFFSQAEGTKLQKMCDEALDSLDIYCQINRELISSWEEAALNGATIRADAQGLYRARRIFIEKLNVLQRRFSQLIQ